MCVEGGVACIPQLVLQGSSTHCPIRFLLWFQDIPILPSLFAEEEAKDPSRQFNS